MTDILKFYATLKALRVKPFQCPACASSLLLKLGNEETSVRCLRCHGTAIHLSLIEVLNTYVDQPGSKLVYELSSRGPLVRYLSRHFKQLTTSEYFDRQQPGSQTNDAGCEDVQKLSFADASFDVCTSTEVFEHVADDMAGFREIKRVLKANGLFILSVPLSSGVTVQRARLNKDKLEHIRSPHYHGDKIRGQNSVLVFRDYGHDITERLLNAGFRQVQLVNTEQAFFGFSRTIVVGKV